ncbi:BglG family transcription antiterminator [Clostridium sp. P21]|uniref:BglG family transcription antiterminator n=1 Tax=Clostridium muellerianum TaxID=2716538 RepID=A0A7Y0EHZ0_9CLOT|nr:BglG family transcription antiterminator [Clostridium muellerianum]NMM63818.1 BglG family transcription antiterminator [Clostridium muellerianum]
MINLKIYCIIEIVGDKVIKDVEYKILNYMIHVDDFLTIKDIAKQSDISERMVRYALDNIEYILKKNNMPELKRKYGLGIKICLTRRQLDTIARKEAIYKNYLGFSNKNRLILYLLKSHYSRTLLELSEFTGVSKATVSKYLYEVEEYLLEKDIKLVKKRNKGIYFVGKEIAKRRLIYDIMLESYDYSKMQGILNPKNMDDLMIKNYFYGIDIKYIWEILRKYLLQRKVTCSDVAFYNMLINTCIMVKRVQQRFFVDIELEKMDYLAETFEYEEAKKYCMDISEKYDVVIPKTEIVWITMHFLGANPVKFLEDDIFISVSERSKLMKCTGAMVEAFEKEICTKFSNHSEIVSGLFVHLIPAINRMKYNIFIKNNLKEDIKNCYPLIFKATVKVCKYVEEQFNIKFMEDEISYICLHFGAALEKMNKGFTTQKRVMVVCSTGIGTSKLLASKLKNNYEDIEIVDILSYNEFISRNTFDIDYVISTVAIKEANVPIIVVNPLINDDDKVKLSKIFNPKVRRNEGDIDTLMKIISSNCIIKDVDKLRKELTQHMFGDYKEKILHIDDLLNEDLVLTKGEFSSAKEAVKYCGKLLLDKGIVNENYVDSLVKSIEKKGKNGPYIVISNGIALPHGRPEDGALDTGFSIITLKEPLCFGHKNHDPVKVIIAFATKDNKSHLKALEEIVTVFNHRENLRSLLKCDTEKDFMNNIMNLVKKEAAH